MKLPVIGRVAVVEDLDLDPIEVPVVAYTIDRKEVEETFRFRPMQPAGATLDILKATGPNGEAPTALVMQFLDECLLEEDRDSWELFLHRPDLMIEQSVLAQIYRGISEVYANRPTPAWSESDGGGSVAGPTSPAAPRAKASRSKPKR